YIFHLSILSLTPQTTPSLFPYTTLFRSITFQRYQGNLSAPIIWASDLVYDHPTRDLAEYIRLKFLLNEDGNKEEIIIFMEDYQRSEEHTSELQSRFDLVCRLLLEKKKY